jgi:hypothetical protein
MSSGHYSDTPLIKVCCSICKVKVRLEITAAKISTPNMMYSDS